MGKHKKYSKHAFTIVELVVAIVIILVLTTISIVVYNGVQQQARDKVALSELQTAFDQVRLWIAEHNGALPASLETAGVKQPSGATITYIPYEGTTKYCISARVDNNTSFMRLSETRGEPISDGCDRPDWVAGAPAGYNDITGSTSSVDITGTPDMTLYVLYEIYNTDTNYSGLGGLSPSTTNNRYYFQNGPTGVNQQSYRIDTSVEANKTGVQTGTRTPGYHIAWLQTTTSGTSRTFAFDSATPTASSTLAAHAGWSFTGLFLAANNGSERGISAIVYKEAHDQATRTKIMHWLATRFNTGLPF